jgi:hypothetical protein
MMSGTGIKLFERSYSKVGETFECLSPYHKLYVLGTFFTLSEVKSCILPLSWMVAVVKVCWQEVYMSINTEKFTTKSVQVTVACCAVKTV